jgi:hypothetical protein
VDGTNPATDMSNEPEFKRTKVVQIATGGVMVDDGYHGTRNGHILYVLRSDGRVFYKQCGGYMDQSWGEIVDIPEEWLPI